VTGFSKTTVSKLVVDAGRAAAWYQDRVFQSLTCKRLQVDEIWGFVSAKAKNADPVKKATGQAGDAWLWLATDAETKLVPCWHAERVTATRRWNSLTTWPLALRTACN
jgi:hypothetical protein